MSASLPMVVLAREPADGYGTPAPSTPSDGAAAERALRALIRGGDVLTDRLEEHVTRCARARGGVDVALAILLAALRKGSHLAELCFHFGDHAREVLGISRRTAEVYARLGDALGSRPLLREALVSGKVRFSAAYEVLPVARGEAEAEWVERASTSTVRALRKAVREAARVGEGDAEEELVRLQHAMTEEERAAVDEALAIAGQLMPGTGRAQQLEAIAQEFLGAAAGSADEPEAVRLAACFRKPRPDGDSPERREAMERETEGWALLPEVSGGPVPRLRLDRLRTAAQIDAGLRVLALLRERWDDEMGEAVRVLRNARVLPYLGFTSFRHYAEERLGLAPRSLEERAHLEEQLHRKPSLREAKAAGLSYERLRLLSRLPDGEIRAWADRARGLTCIQLRRELQGERERQLSAQGKFVAGVPESTALLLSAGYGAVRKLAGVQLSPAACLVVMALHFIEVWKGQVKQPRTPSQRARARDVHCQVPGCSHRAAHAHHEQHRAQGGSDDLVNLVGLCPFHHLRCIHEGHLTVEGEAPDRLVWTRRGQPFAGGLERVVH